MTMPLSLSLMRRMLLQSDYEVVTAKNGAEAVKMMDQEDGPRLALLDWMMPELEGPASARSSGPANAMPTCT